MAKAKFDLSGELIEGSDETIAVQKSTPLSGSYKFVRIQVGSDLVAVEIEQAGKSVIMVGYSYNYNFIAALTEAFVKILKYYKEISDIELIYFRLEMTAEGRILAQVRLRCANDDRCYDGQAINDDMFVALGTAYVAAINVMFGSSRKGGQTMMF
jgi:hypothetical protein